MKQATSKTTPSTRPITSAWLETSIAQATTSRSAITANSACRSGASGVVSDVFRSCAADPGADGADHRGADAGGGERRLGQPGGGGLALGAGHRDQPQPPGGVAVDPGGQTAEDRAGPVDDQGRQVDADLLEHRDAGRVGQHGDRAGRGRVGGEPGAVRAGAGRGDVQVAGLRPAAS